VQRKTKNISSFFLVFLFFFLTPKHSIINQNMTFMASRQPTPVLEKVTPASLVTTANLDLGELNMMGTNE